MNSSKSLFSRGDSLSSTNSNFKLSDKARQLIEKARDKRKEQKTKPIVYPSINVFMVEGLELKMQVNRKIKPKLDLLWELCKVVHPEPFDVIIPHYFFEQLEGSGSNFASFTAFKCNLLNVNMTKVCKVQRNGIEVDRNGDIMIFVEINEELKQFIEYVVQQMIITLIPTELHFVVGKVHPGLIDEARLICHTIGIQNVSVTCNPSSLHKKPLLREDMISEFDYTG